jgi:HSP20 family protein
MSQVKEAPRPKTGGPQVAAKETTSLAKRHEQHSARLARRAANLASRAVSPFAFMRRFAEEMDRMFEDFGIATGRHMPSVFARGLGLLPSEGAADEWAPRIDVMEQDGRLLIRADLPGLTKDDVKVEMTDDILSIQGERKQETKDEREGYSYSECSYGRFYRTIPLPEGVDTTKVSAEFHNGVLEIGIPLPPRPERRARRVEVREKQ